MYVDLLPTQQKVFNLIRSAKPRSINIINYVGGLGSGKTFLGALLTATYIYSFPNSKACMVGPTIPLVRDNTFAQCVKFLRILGIELESLNKNGLLARMAVLDSNIDKLSDNLKDKVTTLRTDY